jgi:hypothetical protein
MIVVSFDVDGTLELGSPPGPVTIAMVRLAHESGYVIGTSSDRTVREQAAIWELCGLVPSFTGHKHHLDRIRDRYPDHRLIHIGDTETDGRYARLAGFEYWDVAELPTPGDRLGSLAEKGQS